MGTVTEPIDYDRFPRVQLGHLPTPIDPMHRLSQYLGSARFFIKRDDCTGLATGGNKTRKLEFLAGDAIQQGAEILVTQGAIQSNHVRQTAAAACRLGIRCHALLERRVPGTPETYETTGNVFLDQIFGASLEFRDPGLDMNAEVAKATEQLRGAGHKAYFIPGGGSNEIGALGYAACAQEITQQSKAMDLSFDWVVTATGSAGTQSGLVAGFHAIGHHLPVVGISVRQAKEKQIEDVSSLVARTLAKMEDAGASQRTKISAPDMLVDDGYVGEGYGMPSSSTLEAISLAARLEGILLDPVYSGKGFAGLIGLARQGLFKSTDRVLFLHTGGSAALFAYRDLIITEKDGGMP